jgi:hypothetical protein
MRLYVVQWCDRKAGWKDIPETAGKREFEVIHKMENLSRAMPSKAMRVIRKPHGWVPAQE